jgi:hypothetical protein
MYKLTKFQVLEPEDKYRQAYRYELEFTRTKSYLFGLITKTHVATEIRYFAFYAEKCNKTLRHWIEGEFNDRISHVGVVEGKAV